VTIRGFFCWTTTRSVRRGLRELFDAQDDLEVVGEASNADEAILRVRPLVPTWPCSTCAFPARAVSRFAASYEPRCQTCGA